MVVSRPQYIVAFARLIERLIRPPGGGGGEVGSAEVDGWLMGAVNLEVHQAELLLECFPDARVICLVRNGISVVASRLRYPPFSGLSFAEHCRVWRRSAKMAQWGAERPSTCRVFRQEWMLDQRCLEEQLSRLFQWLGIDSCPDVSKAILAYRYHPTFDGALQASKPSAYRHASPDERAAMEQQRIDRWRQWSELERCQFVDECGAAMSDLDYSIPWLQSSTFDPRA